MTWDDFLRRIRSAGLEAVEEEFMDDYGLIARRKHAALENRYFRCMFAVARVENARFETYIFPSPADAEEFKTLIEGEGGSWAQRKNLVMHALDGGLQPLERILHEALDAEGSQSRD